MAVEKLLDKVTMKLDYQYGTDNDGNAKIKTQSIRNINPLATAEEILGFSTELDVLFTDGVVGTRVLEEHEIDNSEEL